MCRVMRMTRRVGTDARQAGRCPMMRARGVERQHEARCHPHQSQDQPRPILPSASHSRTLEPLRAICQITSRAVAGTNGIA